MRVVGLDSIEVHLPTQLLLIYDNIGDVSDLEDSQVVILSQTNAHAASISTFNLLHFNLEVHILTLSLVNNLLLLLSERSSREYGHRLIIRVT